MLWLMLSLVVFATIFYKLWKLKNYWKDRQIPEKEPVILFGNLLDNFLRRKAAIEILDELYNLFPNNRYFGFSQATIPILMIRDPELIKQICIKDFDYFPEHQAFHSDDDIDPLFSKNLFSAKVAKWRELRPMLSPTFTSSKMRIMFTLIDECARQFSEYFLSKAEKSIEVELKDVISRFTNDVIATTAFGIECNSLQNKNNEFYLMGKDITDLTGLRNLKLFMITIIPRLAKLLGIKVFPPKPANFFVNIIDATLREREEKKIIRPDLINILLEARRSNTTLKHEEQQGTADAGFAATEESTYGRDTKLTKNELSDEDVYAQCLIFFFAGFDTVSNGLTLALYEIALHPDVQERLRLEIDAVWQECNTKLTYEALNQMKYLDMVISESLRKWVPVPLVDRRCLKAYTIPPVLPDEKPVRIKPGEAVGIPMRCIHLDEKYYPNPHKFDPERFSDENKHNIIPGTYMPFGNGPRNCIGSRFALLEMKTMVFHLLRNFEVVPNKKTQIPLKPSKTSFAFVAENGTWLDFKKRI